MKRFILLLISFSLALSLVGCGGIRPSDDDLSAIVGEAVLSDNENGYYPGECSGEGHRILGSRVRGRKLTVYALTMFGYYGFENDMLVKVSGSGIIPAVLTFEKNGGDYRLLKVEYPDDGNEYAKSLFRMFPLRYIPAVFEPGRSVYEDLEAQEKRYAEEYLKSIGRDVPVGEFRDIEAVLLTDLGVSVSVSNKLSCDRRLSKYPFWIGTAETLEDGIRYIRSLSYDEEAGLIEYKTCEWESGKTVEVYVFDAQTGDETEQDKGASPDK